MEKRRSVRGCVGNTHTRIPGIGTSYHDTAACPPRSAEIIAAASGERFTQVKWDLSFPMSPADLFLAEADITIDGLVLTLFFIGISARW